MCKFRSINVTFVASLTPPIPLSYFWYQLGDPSIETEDKGTQAATCIPPPSQHALAP